MFVFFNMSRLKQEFPLFLYQNVSNFPVVTALRVFILSRCLKQLQALLKYKLSFDISTSSQLKHPFLGIL